MKRILLVIVLAAMAISASSQKVYFLYLQAEPAQPFYVKMNGKIYSSSASGYLILSRLLDSTYSFALGFPQDKVPEQSYTVTLARKDHGFLVKDFGEKGWGLFDLQTLGIQYSLTGQPKTEEKAGPEKKVSPFTDLLSKATGDPSLRDNPPAPKTEEKPVAQPDMAVVQELKKEESKTENKEEAITPPLVKEKAAAAKAEETKPAANVPEPVKSVPAVVMKEEKKEAVKSGVKDPEPVKADPESIVKEEKKEEARPPVKDPEPKPVVPPQAAEAKTVITETPKVMDTETKKEDPKTQVTDQAPFKAEAPAMAGMYKKTTVIKRSESSTTEGFGLVFMDKWEGGIIDTIRLLIPNPKVIIAVVKEQPKEEKKFLDIQATAVKPGEKPEGTEEKPKVPEPVKGVEPQKPDIKPIVTEDKPKPSETVQNEKPAGKPALPAPCGEVASEPDFFALRKAMAAAEGDDEMISQAKKYFKLKCFTVSQIKNLGALFLNDEAKYNFFDVAYKYTTDKAAFAGLESELKDAYYINRFKAMLH